eukprot:CAMPEP_0118825846 /NCGR_PEP_ID=MMETSP1162-20130426/11571_1 /TAXON_ID=33656 /ORGANISM="Phaeocystis Sp, Strain CCMP2710" /LENGTH=142 /DNA_ID=CAMNT_0006756539 /DNA_START=124 /DNA_END=550 /DNA_ORIENTATION=-
MMDWMEGACEMHPPVATASYRNGMTPRSQADCTCAAFARTGPGLTPRPRLALTLRREELDVSAAQVGVVLGHGALRLRRRGEGHPRLARRATVALAEHDAVVAADLQPEEETVDVIGRRPEGQPAHAQRAWLVRRRAAAAAA